MVDKILNNNCFKIFSLIMCYIFCVLFAYTSCKIIKVEHCLNLIYFLSIIVPLSIYLIFFNDNVKNKIICSSIFAFLVLIIPFVFSWTYDYTVDGNSYHKIAIGFMKEGWNTVYQSSLDWQVGNDVVQIPPSSKIDMWIDHYPKATWTIASAMYSYTGSIESGKSINFILMISVGFLLYSVFSQKFSKVLSLLFSILLSFNPILLSQMFSYYLDGLMGACFIIEFVILILLDLCEKKSWLLWILLLCVCALFVNLKYTGLLYSGIIAAIFYFYWLFRDRKKLFDIFKYTTIRFCAIFIIAIGFIGLNSYVKNTIDHHNPLYPLIGKDKVDIVTTMQPKIFSELNSFEKFAWSLFSKTENVTYYSGSPSLKFPLKLYRSELDTIYVSSDIRIGGFGPFFAACFLVGLIFIVYSFINMYRDKNKQIKYFFMFFISILFSCIAVGEGWWARYVPQFYFIPIMGMIMLEYVFNNRIKVILHMLLSVILFANLCCFFYTYDDRLRDFKQTRNELVTMSSMGNIKLDFSPDNNPFGVYFNLKDYKIKFDLVSIDESESVKWIYSWKVRVRLND